MRWATPLAAEWRAADADERAARWAPVSESAAADPLPQDHDDLEEGVGRRPVLDEQMAREHLPVTCHRRLRRPTLGGVSRALGGVRDWIFRCPVADAELGRKWRFLNAALLILSVLATLAGGALLLLGARWIGQVGLMTAVLYVTLFAINHRGAVVFAATCLISLAIVAVVVAALDPSRDLLFAVIVPLLYVIPVTLAGALLSWRAVVAATTATASAMAWLYLSGISQLAPYRAAHPEGIAALTILLVIVLAAVGSFVAVFNYQLMAEREKVRAEKGKSDRLLLDVLPELERKKQELEDLTQELRHQIAARSRDLTEALSRSEASVQPSSLEVGDAFDGRYRVTRPIGRGGMGAVYEVERTRDGRRLALKIVTTELSGRAAARFAREAEIGARVRHENLVSILDVGLAAGGMPFLVMELVRGGSMEERRSRFGDDRWASPILRQIASGLAELHANGIVHRDLKPGNVLLVEDDGPPVAKICDFGISRFGAIEDSGNVEPSGDTLKAQAPDASPPDLTQTGALMGTPIYMPPEALFEPARRPSADLFSFGILAYEALTGRTPFAVPPILVVRARQTVPEPDPMDGVRDEVAAMILACLQVEPAKRPRARDVAAAL
jgi:Protein kinase domain